MKRTLVRLSSPSTSRSAFILPSTTTTQSPPPPPTFIPTPKLRSLQPPSIQSLSTSSPITTTIHFSPSSSPPLTLPNLFLRDSSIHSSHLHPSSQQKLFTSTDIPLEGNILAYGVHTIGFQDCLVTEWSTPVIGVDPSSAKLSVVPVSSLLALLSPSPPSLPPPTPWSSTTLTSSLLTTPYSSFSTSSSSLHASLTSLLSLGITFIKDVPFEQKVGEQTELRKLVERIGSLRRTWYGDLWDVKAEEGSKNIAYTNLDLGLHMDLTHFESPPRYQFLHSLLNSSITGGTSYFVDTFHILSLLRLSSPTSFTTLCTSPLLFSYTNGGQHTRWLRPTVELSPQGDVWAVNYSPPFQGKLPLSTPPTEEDAIKLGELHKALAMFANLAGRKENQFEIQLEPGDCVVFDNRRVLHARTGFVFVEDGGGVGGKGEKERGRWLKGAYMDGDEVWSRWRGLEEELRGEGK